MKMHYDTGEMPRGRRGGNKTGYKFADKKANMRFLNSLNFSEPHYHMNVKKMR